MGPLDRYDNTSLANCNLGSILINRLPGKNQILKKKIEPCKIEPYLLDCPIRYNLLLPYWLFICLYPNECLTSLFENINPQFSTRSSRRWTLW